MLRQALFIAVKDLRYLRRESCSLANESAACCGAGRLVAQRDYAGLDATFAKSTALGVGDGCDASPDQFWPSSVRKSLF
ncbi:MAG: hypothetical protein ACI8PG_003535 [Planctomycetota bacterium]|jgi:hypothetical protein